MKVYLVDVKNEESKVVDIVDSLDTYYDLLDCDCIDIVQRTIGGKRFDIICDDEGLLNGNPKISAINNLGQPMLVGNLIICHSEYGEMVGLEDEDVQHLKGCIMKMYTRQYPKGYMMVTQCE